MKHFVLFDNKTLLGANNNYTKIQGSSRSHDFSVTMNNGKKTSRWAKQAVQRFVNFSNIIFISIFYVTI